MKNSDHDSLKKLLSKKHAAYVLVTCDDPKDDGNMQVEMSYDGDPALAHYLLQGAQQVLEEQDEDELQEIN